MVPDIIWHQWSLWAQDSWKATRKLTLNIGLRADHVGQWYDKLGGTQVWDPASYVNTPQRAGQHRPAWHKIDSKIPISGWKSQLFLYNPRVGIAYDVFGTGKTVVRAGFGTYRYQVSSNDASGAMNGPLGSFDFNTQSTGRQSTASTAITSTNGAYLHSRHPGGLSANCARRQHDPAD